MIDKNEVERIKNEIDCRKYIAESLPLYGKDTAKEWAGACPWCGGTDRFHVTADGWFCREGNGHCGRKGDIIRFVMERQNLSFVDAVNHLLQWQGGQPLPASRPHKEKNFAWDWRCDEWQQMASAEIFRSHDRLPSVMEYLNGRGITQDTARAYSLGYSQGWYGPDDMRAAVTIPWFGDGMISAVRYRFIKPDSDGLRYRLGKFPKNSSGSAGELILFRPPVRRSNIMILVEGEFNALSVYQTTAYDAYATGSQSITAAQLDAIRQAAATYERVLVWQDEPEAAQKLAGMLSNALAMRSPVVNGKKLDANELLKTGQLAALIDIKLGVASPSVRLSSPDTDNTPAHRMLALSDQLGFTWERLPDGSIWMSRWDKELFAQARQLLAQEAAR